MADDVNDSIPETGRALVPVASAAARSTGTRSTGARIPRPSATFLAHLVATAQGAPQTRSRRRASFDHAATLYAAAAPKEPPKKKVITVSM
jgi:hypothetical protein